MKPNIEIIEERFKIQEILTIVSLIFLNVGLFDLLSTKPVSGYELSIYPDLSILFIASIISFCISVFNIILCIQFRKINIFCKLNVIIILFLNFILLTLPLSRGYYFYDKHDGMTHLGYIVDILNSGHIGPSNFYPLLHILSAFLSQIGNISNIFIIREFFTASFFLFFIICIYLLTKKITKSIVGGLCGFILASVPIYSGSFTGFAPTEIFFFMVPFFVYIIYLFILDSDIKIKFLLILGFLPIAYMHPELVLFMVIIAIVILIMPNLFSNSYDLVIFKSNNKIIIPILIIITSFISWYIYFHLFVVQIRRISATLQGQLFNSAYSFTFMQNSLKKANLSLYELIDFIIKTYGAVIIYEILAIVIIIFLLFQLIKYKKRIEESMFFFISLIIIYSILSISTLFQDIIVIWDRTFKYVILSSTILIAIFIVYISNSNLTTKNFNKYYLLFLYCILVVAIIISIFNMFPSPITKTYNQQVTAMEFNSAGWLIQNGNREVGIYDQFFTLGRFANAIEGTDRSIDIDNVYVIDLYSQNRTPPDHFNYQKFSNFGDSIQGDKYLIINKLIRVYYKDLWPKLARYTERDFYQLENDKTSNKIFSNGETEIQFISSNYTQN